MRTFKQRPGRWAQRPGPRNGFTIVDIAVSLVILAVAIGGLVAASTSSYQLSRSNQARATAHEAARAIIAEIRAADPAEVFALYNDDPNDDPGGIGTAPGSGFDVPGLSVQEGDPDGLVGRIWFPGDGTGALREDLVDNALDTPRDLSLDGDIDGDDHADDYVLLPVGVELDWRGGLSNAHYEVHILLVAVR